MAHATFKERGMTSRRHWIGQASRLLAAAGFGTRGSYGVSDESTATTGTPASIRDEFPIAQRRVYLNNASIHPMSTSTRRVVDAYFETRNRGTTDDSASPDVPVDLPRVKALYAALIGAQA